MVICLERGADLHMAQLMPLPLTVSCFSKIQIGFTFLVPAYPGSPGQRAVKRVYVCVCVCACVRACVCYLCGRDAAAALVCCVVQSRIMSYSCRQLQEHGQPPPYPSGQIPLHQVPSGGPPHGKRRNRQQPTAASHGAAQPKPQRFADVAAGPSGAAGKRGRGHRQVQQV